MRLFSNYYYSAVRQRLLAMNKHLAALLLLCNVVLITSTGTGNSRPGHHAYNPASASVAAAAGGAAGAGMIEYCQWEQFNATCESGSVVLMESAHYGRMRHGRCADTDVYIGCSADVLAQLDARCSGRESCTLAIPDATLHQQQPCPNDMMAYLEASFSCAQVAASSVSVDACSSLSQSSPIELNGSDGFMSSYSAALYGHGTSRCPWLITAPSGQRVELTVLDFSLSSRYRTNAIWGRGGQDDLLGAGGDGAFDAHLSGGLEYCHVYATVVEGRKADGGGRVRGGGGLELGGAAAGGAGRGVGGRGEFTICASNAREKHVYTSQTNAIVVELSAHAVEDPSANFIIKYRVTGCADLVPPKNAWVSRVKEKTIVTCNHTLQIWHLVCKGTKWVGVTADCEAGAHFAGERLKTGPPFPAYGLVLAVVIGIVVGSICGFALLAAILYCKRRSEMSIYEANKSNYDVELVARPGEQVDNYSSYIKSQPQCLQQQQLQGDYAYTHVWQPFHSTGAGNVPPLTDYEPAVSFARGRCDAAPEVVASSAAAASMHLVGGRRCCNKDHIYESPTSFDDGTCLELERAMTGGGGRTGGGGGQPFVFTLYYCHSMSRRQQQQQQPTAIIGRQHGGSFRLPYDTPPYFQDPCRLPLNDDLADIHHGGRDIYSAGYIGDPPSPAPNAVHLPSVGAAAAGPDETVDMEDDAGARYQLQGQCPATAAARYEPVVCRGSSSEPDVESKPRTENHYT